MPERSLSVSFYLLLLCGLIVANVQIYRAAFAPPPLSITVLEAGKGTATLVKTSGGKTVLIDTGSDASIVRALGTTLSEWQRTIDSVVLTGGKASFAGGLPALESRYQVKNHLKIGDQAAPYGKELKIDENTSIIVISPGIFSISHGDSTLLISSSTPPGTFISDSTSLQK